jgi:hypothetical protein
MLSSRISNELALQPGDTAGINQLMARYPYFETIYLLKAEVEKNNAENVQTVHRAALACNNPAWLKVLLSEPENNPAVIAATETTPIETTLEHGSGLATTAIAVALPEIPKSAETTAIAENSQPEPVTEMAANTADTATNVIAGTAIEIPAENTTNEVVVTVQEQAAENNTTTLPVITNDAPVTNDDLTTNKETESLAFEPYHTVDYFASQGIKITKDTAPTDRLSLQLKSFTEWLKTMKRLNTNEIEAVNRPAQQEAVVQMAETSLKKTEVITETMAEVLVKQGRVDEAIEILKKLSLQDKAKSAYFAARIQHLKTI